MPRTKGSLGKKTIEKLKAENKWDYTNNCPLKVESDTFPDNLSGSDSPELLPDLKADNLSPEIQSDSETILPQKNCENVEEIKKIENEENNSNDINDATDTIVDSPEITVEDILDNLTYDKPESKKVNKSIRNSNKSNSKYNSCERCGKTIFCEPRRIDTNILSGMADYYRSSPRYVQLCTKCCKELSDIIEKWLTDESSGGNSELCKYNKG